MTTRGKQLIYQILIGISILVIVLNCTEDKNESITIPVVLTGEISQITHNSAICEGILNFNGGDNLTEKGVCWSTDTSVSVSDSLMICDSEDERFTCKITGLLPQTTYYVRAYASNKAGISYGEIISFTTHIPPIVFNPNISYETLTDQQGNVYKTVNIGNQTWMAENLRTTIYNDGTNIPFSSYETEWKDTEGKPAYYWYDNDSNAYAQIYGALYNWYAVNAGKLCPAGWHVPTDEEWTELTDFLGGQNVASGKLKETDTIHWNSPNIDATNESGFTAVPGGVVSFWGYNKMGNYCYFHSSTENVEVTTHAWYRYFNNDINKINRDYNGKGIGYSIRCVKD